MPKKSNAPIKTQEDLDRVIEKEGSLYYIAFLGDAVVIRDEMAFSRAKAEKHYVMLANHTLDMLREAKTKKEKKEASAAFLSLVIMELRIH